MSEYNDWPCMLVSKTQTPNFHDGVLEFNSYSKRMKCATSRDQKITGVYLSQSTKKQGKQILLLKHFYIFSCFLQVFGHNVARLR